MEGRRLYPIGIQTFSKLKEGNYVYVDKTELVCRMTHGASGYIFLSVPAVSEVVAHFSLHSYFEEAKDLFESLAIEYAGGPDLSSQALEGGFHLYIK